MSSSLQPVPTTRTANISGKKRRPTFRPANQRKAPPSKAAPAREKPDDPQTVTPTELQPAAATENVASVPVAAPPVKRTKKRSNKVSTAVSIGQSRPDEEPVVPAASIAVRETEPSQQPLPPSVATGDTLPLPVPGKPTLQKFCSSFRSKNPKEKRAKPKPQTPALATNASTEKESAQKGAGPVVQIVNGEIVLQEASMVVPGARKTLQEVEEEFEQVVEEEGHSAVVGASYNSFVSRRAPQHWSVEETKSFYNILRQVGPDFATMEAIFDNRTRRQLKRKYQIENSKNPHLIELALNPKAQLPLDMSAFNVEVDVTKKTSGTAANKNKTPPAEAPQATAPPPAPAVAPPPPTETQPRDASAASQDPGGATEGSPAEATPAPIAFMDELDTVAASTEVQVPFAFPPTEPFFSEEVAGDADAETSTAAIPLAPKQSKTRAKRKFKARK